MRGDPTAKVRVTLRHDGTDYTYEQEWREDDTVEETTRNVYYMYTDGNYGCDCNRSLFIDRYCDDAPDKWPNVDDDGDCMKCGRTIELKSLTYVAADESEHPITVRSHGPVWTLSE